MVLVTFKNPLRGCLTVYDRDEKGGESKRGGKVGKKVDVFWSSSPPLFLIPFLLCFLLILFHLGMREKLVKRSERILVLYLLQTELYKESREEKK